MTGKARELRAINGSPPRGHTQAGRQLVEPGHFGTHRRKPIKAQQPAQGQRQQAEHLTTADHRQSPATAGKSRDHPARQGTLLSARPSLPSGHKM